MSAPGDRTALADALALLSRRDLTAMRLRERLERRGHAEAEVAAALERCRELQLLDDRAYGLSRAGAVLRRRPCGRRALLDDLRRQGVPPTMLEQVADEAYAERGGESEVLSDALQRWVNRHGPPSDWPMIRRCADHLGRRGFPGSDVQSALSPWLDEVASP